MESKNKRANKQHYLSQFFLRNFSADKKNMYIFNKDLEKAYPSSIRDAAECNKFFNVGIDEIIKECSSEQIKELDLACERDFGIKYSEMTKEQKEDVNHSLDDRYSDIYEPAFREIIQDCIDRVNTGKTIILNQEEKTKFSDLLALFYVRTRYFRDSLVNAKIDMMEQIIPILAQSRGVALSKKDFTVNYSDDQARIFHLQAMMDEKVLKTLSDTFYSGFWIFSKICGREKILCPDTILVKYSTEANSPMFPNGLGSYGVVIFVPLTSTLLLTIFDPVKYHNITDCVCVKYTEEQTAAFISPINDLVINESHKYTFSENLEQIKDYKKMNK